MSSEVSLRFEKPRRRDSFMTSFSRSTNRTPPRLGRINGEHRGNGRTLRERAGAKVLDSYNSGTIQLSLGNLEEAEHLLMESIRASPGLEKAWNNLGVCLMRKRTYEEAIRCFKEALSIDPSYGIAKLNLEECMFLQLVK
jgi:tetratricopeptide (TPR) repeat protein